MLVLKNLGIEKERNRRRDYTEEGRSDDRLNTTSSKEYRAVRMKIKALLKIIPTNDFRYGGYHFGPKFLDYFYHYRWLYR